MEYQDHIFQLYMHKLSGELTPEEEAGIARQLEEDPAFREAWEALAADARSQRTAVYVKAVAPESGLSEMKQRRQPKSRLRAWAPYAAAAVLLGAGAWYAYQSNTTTSSEIVQTVSAPMPGVSLTMANGKTVHFHPDSAAQTVALGGSTLRSENGTLDYESQDTSVTVLNVPAGGTYKLVLSDGTEVRLNASSRLHFPFHFGAAAREVTVEGEAYFRVAKEAKRPFIVHTRQADVQVLGTSFNINTYTPGSDKTALVEGSVLLKAHNGRQLTLAPGQQGESTGTGLQASAFDADEVLSWMNGIRYYHNATVPDLLEEASRFYGLSFEPASGKFSGVKVTGLMDRERLQDFLNDLATTTGGDVDYNGHSIRLH